MQSPIVMSFRKRLKKRGYTDVCIKRKKDDINCYIVMAVDPLASVLVTVEYTLGMMDRSFRF